jgi:hypothetical protein
MNSSPHDYKVEHRPDGGIIVRLHNGSIVGLGADGSITATLPKVSKVGIKNLGEVESHAITTIAGSRSHVVRFINGGLLQFAYNNVGDIIELSSENLKGQLTPNNEMVYSIS